jgi:hypothetical protein
VTDPVRQIVDAVLYEGYVLWPYRRSAIKNQQRFTFGGVYPRGWPEDASRLQTQCLLTGDARVEVTLRFLQIVHRQAVDEADYLTWDEAIEREVVVPPHRRHVPIEIAAGERVEDLADGTLVRRWQAIEAAIEVGLERVGAGVMRVSVAVENTATWDGEPRAATLGRTLCSTHLILRAHGGEFVSQTDPPAALRDVADGCRNEGLWPVLVGEPGDRSTMMASPIILEDYPRVAPESPGELFDNSEIDGLLTLSILALSDAEKAEMRASDPRTRAILERAEALPPEAMARLHGTLRSPP